MEIDRRLSRRSCVAEAQPLTRDALRRENDRLAHALETAEMVAWEWDPATDEIVYSASAHRVLGFPVTDELRTSQDFLAMVHPNDRERVRRALERALGEVCEYREQFRFVKSDGSVVWLADTGHPTHREPDNPPCMAGVLSDITERMNLEQDLRRRIEELAEIDRRKDDFLAVLGHELRNPLAAIVNGVQVLDLVGEDDEEAVTVRQAILRQARHMTRLTDDLLDASRIGRGKVALRYERFDLVPLLKQTADDIRPVLEDSGCTLEVQLSDAPIWIDGDAIRIAQVTGNVLHNAAKFTDAGGRVALAAHRVPGELLATITIRDTGIGMNHNTLERVFVPFRQAERSLDRSRGGLGLGLALVKNLVELHGGTVAARSDGLGRGSEFLIHLPVSVEQSPPAAPIATKETEGVTPKFRILVVEDTPAVAKLFAMMLQQLGHEVELASSGMAALERLRGDVPDVIFSDISMPGMSGYEFARDVRKNPAFREISLVAMTGFGQPEDRDAALEAGFDDHLVKPADFESLQKLIQTIASRRNHPPAPQS